jgi:hypothetical protein
LLDVTCVDYFGQPDGFRTNARNLDRNRNLVRKRADGAIASTCPRAVTRRASPCLSPGSIACSIAAREMPGCRKNPVIAA